MLTVTNNPAKQKGVKVSRWVACHNPVVFKVQTDAIPNTRDTPENFVSVADSRGFAVFTLSSTSNPDWYRPFLKISIDGYIYSDVGTVTRFDPETLEVYTDLAFNGDDSGEVVKFYDGYLIDLLPTIGLPSGHVWENQKPESLGSVQQIEPSGGVAVFDIQKQLQRNVSAKNDLFQVSFPNDLNAFTGFRVAYRESYIDLLGEIEESTAISAYDELSGFVSLTVASVSGFSSGGYAILEGFTEGKYNGAVVKIRQVVNSTALQIEVSYDAYLSLSASETIQPYSLDLVRFSGSYTNEGSQYWAVNSSMELGSFYGTNLVDYVASSPSELAEFMTVFSERNVFIDQFEDFTIIVDTPLLDSISGDVVMAYRQEQYDKGGNLIASDIEVITSQGEGVYRLPTGGNPTEAVTNLVAEGGVLSISLTWDALETIPLFAKYEIWRSSSADVLSTGSLLATSETNSFTDTAISSGDTYYYIVRAIGAYASKFSNEESAQDLSVLRIYTTWDTSTDGAFDPTIAGGTKTWIFGSDTATGDNPNYSGSYLDGTLKTVIVTSSDFSLINSVTLTDYKLTGALDVSLLTGSPSFTAQTATAVSAINNSFTNIIAPSEPFSAFTIAYYQGTDIALATDSNFRVNSSPNLESVTITGGTTNQIFFVVCPSLTSFTHLGTMAQGIGLNSTPNVADITVSSGASSGSLNFRSILGNIDFGSYVINDFTSFVFGESGTTTASLDQAWVEIDRVATVTGIARTIDGSRATASPSATSLTARNSLISKGYTLLI